MCEGGVVPSSSSSSTSSLSFSSLSPTPLYAPALQKLHKKFNFWEGKVFSSLYFPINKKERGGEKRGKKEGREGGVLVLCGHHLVVDVVSWRVIFEELKETYEKERRLLTSSFSLSSSPSFFPVLSFCDWAKGVNELKRHHHHQQQEDFNYWTKEYREAYKTAPFLWGLPPLLYPLSHSQTILLPLSQSTPSTMILQSICTAALRAISYPQQQQQPLSLGIESHGRDPIFFPQQQPLHPHSTIGWFTTLLPLTVSPFPPSSLHSLLQMVGEKLKEREGRAGGREGERELSVPFVLVNYLGRGAGEEGGEEEEWVMGFDESWVGECVERERGMISPVEITALFSPSTNELIIELSATTPPRSTPTPTFNSSLFFTSLRTCLSPNSIPPVSLDPIFPLSLTPSPSLPLSPSPLSLLSSLLQSFSLFSSSPKEEILKFLNSKNLKMFEVDDVFPLSPIQEVMARTISMSSLKYHILL